MSPAEAVFFAALAKVDPAERAAYLNEACGIDADLRCQVDRLLAAHHQVGSFLQDDAAAPPSPRGGVGREVRGGATVDKVRASERPGTVIGPYKLLQQIGEGGMGTVYMAEQTHPVQRKVALKVIKPGMDSRQVIARFEAERQALALMDHVNIARVFDGGATENGRPYFVMELVHGVPITKYCDDNHLTPRERLELFIPVCQAIQHAHQKGVIHRDVKPSNVMVTLYDGRPVPKVIDFGVAKATEQKLTERTLFTQYGTLVGTLEYMSPEQAEMSALGVDTRSDVYALGVLLYELLTGSTPLTHKRMKEAAYGEILRMIKEEEPPRPSARLSDSGEALASIAANRHTEPAKLTKLVRGELDWIVMKCLEKDRNRRYETAGAFAADVQRNLNDEPVHACPPSAGYRLRKFVRRNTRALATLALLGVMLLLAVTALAVSYVQTSDALQHETQARENLGRALEREHQTSEDLAGTAYIQRIALAERQLDAGNVGRAEELLDDCPGPLRGWEWHFLKRQRYGNPPPMQHPATVIRVLFHPDGRQIASVCMDGTITLRDARTGQVLQRLEPATALLGAALVRGASYSRDGRYLAVARNDGQVRVWDPSCGKLLHTLQAHKGPAWQVAFSPDGRTLASGGSDRKLRLWVLASGELLREFSDNPAAVNGVAFRPDGRSVVAACGDGTVKVWDRDTGQVAFSFRGEHLESPWSPSFSLDARRLGWSCLDDVVKVWDTTTGRLEIDQQTNTYRCRAVAFSPDGARIALAGFDGTVRLLNAVTGREMLTIFAHPRGHVTSVAFSPDGHQLASASYDQTVRLWDATPLAGDPLAPHCVTLPGHGHLVSGVAFSPHGRWLASGSWDHTVKLWELSGASEPGAITLRHTLRGHRGIVTGVAFSSDRRTLASVGWDDTVKLWDLQAPKGDSLDEIRSIPFAQRVISIAFSPDGGLLAIGQDNGIALYDPATGKPVHPFKRTPAAVPVVAFHPDRPLLISSGASDPAVKVWALAAGKFSFEIRHRANPSSFVAVSPDGRRLAAPVPTEGTGDRVYHPVTVWNVDWDTKTWAEFRTLRGHQRFTWRVAFSPDGRYLATGSWDATIKVWDLEDESAEPVTLRGHAGFIHGLAFSPDGQHLASGSGYAGHGELKVWDATLWRAKTKGGH
jgi:WD40 repeat protein/serine/threonine protein kinase